MKKERKMRRGHVVHPTDSIKETWTQLKHKSRSGVVSTYWKSNLRKDKFQKKYLTK